MKPDDQAVGAVADDPIGVDETGIGVVDRSVGRFEIEEDGAAEGRLVIASVVGGETGVDLVEEMSLSAHPPENGFDYYYGISRSDR